MAEITEAKLENAEGTQVRARINGVMYIGIYPGHPQWDKVQNSGAQLAVYVKPVDEIITKP